MQKNIKRKTKIGIPNIHDMILRPIFFYFNAEMPWLLEAVSFDTCVEKMLIF